MESDIIIAVMWAGLRFLIFVAVLFMAQGTDATSLLRPVKDFPVTSSDFSFEERKQNLAEGYEPYAGMSAYQIMEFERIEEAIDNAIEAELRAAGINDEHFMTPAEEALAELQAQQRPAVSQPVAVQQAQQQPVVSQSVAVQPVQQQPVASQSVAVSPATPGGYAYCSKTHPGLAGQKIPFGMPLNTNDLAGKQLSAKAQKLATRSNLRMYCDGYYCRPNSQGDRPHVGIDFGCNGDFYQMPVYATADGVVQKVGVMSAAGRYIRIDHGAGWATQYKHMDKIFVTEGQQVAAGCLIGLLGHTGGNQDYAHLGIAKSMSHLHYEIKYSGSKRQITAPNGKQVAIKYGKVCKNGKGFNTFADPKPLVYYQE